MFRINTLLYLAALFLLATAQSENSTEASNPFSSTYQLWSPIDDLAPRTKVMPLFIEPNRQTDLAIISPNNYLTWYDNIRGLGTNSSALPISTRTIADFGGLNFQSVNLSDIVYIDQPRKSIVLAKNPYVTSNKSAHEKEEADRNVTWPEQVIFSISTASSLSLNLNPNWQQTYFISSILKLDSGVNVTNKASFLISLEDVAHQDNAVIIMLNNTQGTDTFTIIQAFTLNNPGPVRVVSYADFYNQQTLNIVVLINGQLYSAEKTSDSAKRNIRKMSDIKFPDTYNFGHIYWVTLPGETAKSAFFMHPQTHKLGALINLWESGDTRATNLWDFIEVVHFSLQIGTEAQTDANDCIIIYPKNTTDIYDFLCVTDTDLRYYTQDLSTQNITLPSDSTKFVQMNIFHDMPLHMIVWNSSIKHDHIFCTNESDTSAFVLYSSTQGIVSWIERNKIELDSVGWTTNFWILIMIYCLLMSIIAGVIHIIVTNQLTKYRRDDTLLGSRLSHAGTMAAAPGHDIAFSFGPNRRTTV